MTKSGVGDSIMQDFIQLHSGIDAMPVSLPELREKMQTGCSGLGTLIFKGKNEGEEDKYWGHEISIIGYDECMEKYICKDSQKMELIYCGANELDGYKEYNKKFNKDFHPLYYIEKDLRSMSPKNGE